MKMMKGVLLASIPITLYALYSYRLSAFILILSSVAAAVASEAIYQKLAGRQLKVNDLSAVVTGLLFSFTLSPSTPVYVAVISVTFGIVVGKQLSGGFGNNLFNPALLGRLFLIFAFPAALSPWQTRVDMVSTATPLTNFWQTGEMVSPINAFVGLIPGSMGEMSALLILIGGLYLIYKKYARWRIPVSILATVTVFALAMGHNPFFQLFTGSIMLGSFFYAVDPMTSPRFPKAQWVFGAGVGLIIMIMRFWGWAAEGMLFGVLIMNMFVPVLDAKLKN